MQIREADLNFEGAKIAAALTKYLNPLADTPRFEWLYKRNPHGAVRVWLASDNDDIIATAAAFPRRAYISKIERLVWVLGDFCVSGRHRTLGPAVALQRALLQACDRSGVPASYDFPSSAMTAVYKRLNIEPSGRMIRMAKVLRVDSKARERISNEWLKKTVVPLGNAILQVTSAAFDPSVDKTLKISLQDGSCGPEFDGLAQRVGVSFDFCVRRSADYLNWRYFENSYKKHGLMTAERDGALLGFVIFSQNGLNGELVDLFGEDDDAVIGRLISEVLELFRRCGVNTVSAELIASHPWIGLFKKFHFYPREDKPFIIYPTPKYMPTDGARPDQTWFITGGDRDS
jgi:hypothetical protein